MAASGIAARQLATVKPWWSGITGARAGPDSPARIERMTFLDCCVQGWCRGLTQQESEFLGSLLSVNSDYRGLKDDRDSGSLCGLCSPSSYSLSCDSPPERGRFPACRVAIVSFKARVNRWWDRVRRPSAVAVYGREETACLLEHLATPPQRCR